MYLQKKKLTQILYLYGVLKRRIDLRSSTLRTRSFFSISYRGGGAGARRRRYRRRGAYPVSGLGAVHGDARDCYGDQTYDLDAGDDTVWRAPAEAMALAVHPALHHARERVADGDDHADHRIQVGHGRVGSRHAHDPFVVSELDVAHASGTTEPDRQVVLRLVATVQVAPVDRQGVAVRNEVHEHRVGVQAVVVRVPWRQQVYLV